MTTFTTLLFFLLYLSLTVSCNNQPNIIFIFADDLGYSDVGFTGGDMATPVLDCLAREGVILTQHYVQPLCTPSRGALISGRYPIHTGLQHSVITPGAPWGLPLDEVTLPEVLKEYNYSTHAIGKWHLGMHTWEHTPVFRGFDDFYGFYQGGENYTSHMIRGGFDMRHDYIDANGEFVDDVLYDTAGRYSTELFSEYTVNLLDKLQTQQNPFFIYLAIQNVHEPLMAPQKYIDKYAGHVSGYNQKIYAAMVGAMDEAVGNVTEKVVEAGLDENTIIIFSSDNGGPVVCVDEVVCSNYPNKGGKGDPYEGGIRSASFVWAKNRLSPGISHDLIHVTDWLPTLWSIASLQGRLQPNNPISTKPLDGVDQWLTISQSVPSNRTEFIINIDPELLQCGEHQVPHAALRSGDWKLIIGGEDPMDTLYASVLSSLDNGGSTNGTVVELYHINLDPSETMNVAYLYPDVVRELAAVIERYRGNMVPINNKGYDPASNPEYFNNTWMPWL